MKVKRNIPLHHAYLISGNRDEAILVRDHILNEILEVTIEQNPDVLFETHETFGIDESRVLKERHVLKPLAHKKVSIMEVETMTTEAMNALLKIFEEPARDHHFIILMPNASSLIPTLLSRVFHIELTIEVEEGEDGGGKIETQLVKAMGKAKSKKNSKKLSRALRLLSALRMRGTSEKQIGDLSKILFK